MKQNYNNPLFVFDASGIEPEDLEAAFIEQFKNEYPITKEALIFAKAGGPVIYKEVSEDGSEFYMCNVFKLTNFAIQSEGAVLFTFTYPDSESGEDVPIMVEYTSDGGGLH